MSARAISILGLILFAGGFVAGHWFASNPVHTTAAPMSAPATVDRPVVSRLPAGDADRRLREQLLRANAEISRLASRNSALRRQIENMNLPLPSDTTLPELMQRIERLPASVVRQQLALIFGDDYADGVVDPHALAQELIEIALEEEAEPEQDLQVGIGFSLSPARGLRAFSSLEQIDARDRVFAHFDPNLAFANLVLRWQHRETGEILLFEPLQLDASHENYRSLKPRDGWREGNYTVSVYNLDDNRRLVGSNSYRVASVVESELAADDSGVDREVIEDLLSTGQAVPKTF